MSSVTPYNGRRWLLALRHTSLRPFVDWALSQSTAFRAMLLPFLGSCLSTAVCLALIRGSATSLIDPVLGLGLTGLVFWPLALGLAVGMDLVKKEHRLQSRLESSGTATPRG